MQREWRGRPATPLCLCVKSGETANAEPCSESCPLSKNKFGVRLAVESMCVVRARNLVSLLACPCCVSRGLTCLFALFYRQEFHSVAWLCRTTR